MSKNLQVNAVTGPIPASELGFTLPHEHIMVDFGGAATAGKHRYDPQDVVKVMQPYLEALVAQGVKTFIECTPNYLGRDAEVFSTLSQLTGLNIITNTGLYNNQYLPDYCQDRSAESLADDWIREFEEGIDGTQIKPGFIKTAVNPEPNEMDLKLIHAAALAHRQTGLTIATHTCTATAAEQVVRVLEVNQVELDRWIFVHAHLEENNERVLELAKKGVWIELDGLGFGGDQEHADKLLTLLEQGYEDQILISQDAGWYHIGEEHGGEVVAYTRLKNEFLPMIQEQGVSSAIIEKITWMNPAKAFAVRK